MINYIQQLLPRIRAFSSNLDRKELFINKLFTLLQPNDEVHQYTFNRDGRLILSIDGITTIGTWELLATGQLLINRGTSIITLDFDFLHPDVLIMKMGGTIDNPFIIYDKNIIKDGNVFKFLKIFDAEKRNQRIFTLPNTIILESDVHNKIFDENGNPYNGIITSSPYSYYKYPHKVEDIKNVDSGIVIESYFDVKYIYSQSYDLEYLVVIRQKDIEKIEVGDKIILNKSFKSFNSKFKASIVLGNKTLFFDEDYVLTNIKSNSDWKVYLSLIFFVAFLLFIYIFISSLR